MIHCNAEVTVVVCILLTGRALGVRKLRTGLLLLPVCSRLAIHNQHECRSSAYGNGNHPFVDPQTSPWG